VALAFEVGQCRVGVGQAEPLDELQRLGGVVEVGVQPSGCRDRLKPLNSNSRDRL
jgi:hypothetical protein